MANSEQSDLIEMALQQALAGYKDKKEGDILGDWAVVAYVDNPEREKGQGCALFFSNGVMPTYRARGLFSQAINELNEEELLNIFVKIFNTDDEEDE